MSDRNVTEAPAIHGPCAPAFASVRAAFEANFTRGELGAAVCIILEGHTVVDLWGGWTDAGCRTPWQRDTIVPVFSCTKGAVASCVHMLADAGEVHLDRAVGYYWPSFARAGKAGITLRMLLNHQAGLPGVSQDFPPEAIYEPSAMASLLERERPLWSPGTRVGYHAMTFGWLLGEIVRRVSGQSVGAFFSTAIAQPRSLDFWIGLPERDDARVASLTVPVDVYQEQPLGSGHNTPTDRVIDRAVWKSYGDLRRPGALSERRFRAAELPALNGITNARGLAALYSALGGLTSNALMSCDQLSQMRSTESAALIDAVNREPLRFSAGFEKSACARETFRGRPGIVMSEEAFGHSGRGGAVGFLDPARRLAFGYALNSHDQETGMRSRAQALIDASYTAVGARSCGGGKWY
jgi:CubicO group peptidase (beta-lactamase class C family)